MPFLIEVQVEHPPPCNERRIYVDLITIQWERKRLKDAFLLPDVVAQLVPNKNLWFFADNPGTTAKLPGAQRSGVEFVAGCAADTAYILGCHAGLSVPAGPNGPPTKA